MCVTFVEDFLKAKKDLWFPIALLVGYTCMFNAFRFMYKALLLAEFARKTMKTLLMQTRWRRLRAAIKIRVILAPLQ